MMLPAFSRMKLDSMTILGTRKKSAARLVAVAKYLLPDNSMFARITKLLYGVKLIQATRGVLLCYHACGLSCIVRIRQTALGARF